MQVVDICDRNLCTGCGACDNACPKRAISMEPDAEGFLFPIIEQSACVNCGLCRRICPIIAKKDKGPARNPLAVFAGYHLNPQIRKNSASGGVFPAFATLFYGFDNGIVAAAAFDKHLNLRHVLSSKKSDLPRYQGSKYLQSEIGHVYLNIQTELLSEKRVLFVGTPCQVAGLKSFLRRDFDNLFTIDLVCHGVPSPKLFHSYLTQVGILHNKEYRNFFFRSRNNSAYFQHAAQSKFGFIKKISPSSHSFICAYLKGWLHRESCYRCPFSAIPRQGDCSIADFWGILLKKVSFNGDIHNGVSMIMINNAKGQSVFEQIKSSLYLEEKTLEEAMVDNHNILSPDVRPEIRNNVYSEILEMDPSEFMIKYHLNLPLPASLWERVRSKVLFILRRNGR